MKQVDIWLEANGIIWLSIKRKLITWSFIKPELKQNQMK